MRYVQQLGKDFGTTDLAEAGHWALMASAEWLADDLVREANQGHEPALYWVKRLVRNRVTDGLKKDVKALVERVHAQSCFSLDIKTGACGWKYLAPEDNSFPDIEIVYALMVARLIGADFVKNVRQCEAMTAEDRAKRCPNYFVSLGRGRWCKPSCGSRQRMRDRRDAAKGNNYESRYL